MRVVYHTKYNIDVGLLSFMHPFDGMKFEKVFKSLDESLKSTALEPTAPIDQAVIDEFTSEYFSLLLTHKKYLLKALELPTLGIIPEHLIKSRLIEPMKWAVSGTLLGLEHVLQGEDIWNLGGGYHHASQKYAEGFCIYNDLGIAHQELMKSGGLKEDTDFVIIDIDAHHGNGNAEVFLENEHCQILDIYNKDIYPQSTHTRARVDIAIPLSSGTGGDTYLSELSDGLDQISSDARFAVVIAGTDVLQSDPLGGFSLSLDECEKRDRMVFERLSTLNIPTLAVGGGGYSKESAEAMHRSIDALSDQDRVRE